MTPEQIKERCVDVMYELKEMIISEESSNEYLYEQRLAKLESLYREAMAKGLEMAMIEAANRDFGDGDDFVQWCYKHITTLKEAPQ